MRSETKPRQNKRKKKIAFYLFFVAKEERLILMKPLLYILNFNVVINLYHIHTQQRVNLLYVGSRELSRSFIER